MATKLELEKGFAIGDKIAVKFPGTTQEKYYEITQRDTIFYVSSHSAVAAGSTSSYTSVSDLDPPTGQLYQIYKIKLVKGNVKVYIKQPAATNRWGTNKSPEAGYLTPYFDEAEVNLFIMQDYPPSVQIKNDTDVSITPVLRWFGWRYAIKELPTKPEIYTKIQIGGIGE